MINIFYPSNEIQGNVGARTDVKGHTIPRLNSRSVVILMFCVVGPGLGKLIMISASCSGLFPEKTARLHGSNISTVKNSDKMTLSTFASSALMYYPWFTSVAPVTTTDPLLPLVY